MDKISTKSFRETQKAGEEFAKDLKAGQIVLLSGELGAGKTTFVQGLAGALGVKDRIISPTFVLVRKHKLRIKNHESGIKNIYHIDLYRLEGEVDIKSLGLDDIFEDTNGVFLIEWGEKHENLGADWEIEIKATDENSREIKIKKNE